MSNTPKDFVIAYLECALWSSTDDDGTPLDKGRDFDDIAPVSKRAMIRDCVNFYAANEALLAQAGTDEQNGHDYWLTRNGHGAGFWDRGYPCEVGKPLTEAARNDGSCDLYIGDDNKVHAL